jgi:hypothetical protein
MAMPDAIDALLNLSMRSRIASCRAYNVRAFNSSADEIRASALRRFPTPASCTKSTPSQAIVDSWRRTSTCTSARRDWDFARHDGFRSCVSRIPDPHNPSDLRGIGGLDCDQHRQARWSDDVLQPVELPFRSQGLIRS